MAGTRILLVTGSTRSGSTNTAALRTIAATAPEGVEAILCDVLRELPAFDPDQDGEVLPAAPAQVRRAIAEADAVLFCTPEYAGTLPGSLKNLLDWLVGGTEITAKPCALLTVAGAGRGAGATATLRVVLGYVTAQIVEDACRTVEVRRDAVGPDGLVSDADVRARLLEVLDALVRGAREP